MANMGLPDLFLVNPRVFPDPAATARAAGAEHVLERTRVFGNLAEAVADCGCVIGATARRRSVAWPVLEPKSAAQRLVHEGVHTPAALVFGPEASGLSNEHLDLCHAHVRIDVETDFSSLNVATAVAILAYELRRHVSSAATPQAQIPSADLTQSAGAPPMTMGEFDRMMDHLERVVQKTGFLVMPRTRLLRKLRRLFLRGVRSREEVNILRGVLTSIEQPHGGGEPGSDHK